MNHARRLCDCNQFHAFNKEMIVKSIAIIKSTCMKKLQVFTAVFLEYRNT